MDQSISQWNRELELCRERKASLHLLERQSKQLQTRLNIEKKRVKELEVELDREQEDVDKLVKLSWSNLFHTLLKNKDEQLELERQEALAVSLKLQQSKNEVIELEREIREAGEQLDLVSGTAEEYERLLSMKEQWIRGENAESAHRLTELDELLATKQLQSKEWNEAINACRQLVSALQVAEDKLNSAANWGTYDMLGGGIISTSIKHSKIDEARDAIYEARHLLNKLITELKDVNWSIDVTIDIGSMATFADYFFDGLITDWIVQGRIKESQERIGHQLVEAKSLMRKLEDEAARSERQQSEWMRERGLLIEQYV
ncbi:MAG: hypothetical protein ACE3L7_12745 [Candidatus Pristimantibacillus sp.]